MKKPMLVLQYPDARQGRTIALAATRSRSALLAFKQAILEDTRLAVLDWDTDEVLRVHDKAEQNRLVHLMELLIPDDQPEEGGCG